MRQRPWPSRNVVGAYATSPKSKSFGAAAGHCLPEIANLVYCLLPCRMNVFIFTHKSPSLSHGLVFKSFVPLPMKWVSQAIFEEVSLKRHIQTKTMPKHVYELKKGTCCRIHLELITLKGPQPVDAGVCWAVFLEMRIGRDTEHPGLLAAARIQVYEKGTFPHSAQIITFAVSTGFAPCILQLALKLPTCRVMQVYNQCMKAAGKGKNTAESGTSPAI